MDSQTFSGYSIKFIDIAIVIVLIILIIVITRKEKKEHLLGLATFGPPLVQDLINDLSRALAGVNVLGSGSNSRLEISYNDDPAITEAKRLMNRSLDVRDYVLNKIKISFQKALDDNINNYIRNKLGDTQFSFIADISSNLLNNININIRPKDNTYNELITRGTQDVFNRTLKPMIQFGMYNKNSKYKSRFVKSYESDTKIFFIVRLDKHKIITTQKGGSMIDVKNGMDTDVYILDISEYLEKLHIFIKTYWTCIGNIHNNGHGYNQYYPCNTSSTDDKNNQLYHYDINDKQLLYTTQFNRNKYGYVLKNKKNISISPDIFNTDVTKQFFQMSSKDMNKIHDVYSDIEIYQLDVEFIGRCLKSNNIAPFYIGDVNVNTLDDCKNQFTMSKYVTSKKTYSKIDASNNAYSTNYAYNQNNKKCNTYNPSLSLIPINEDSPLFNSITKGDNDNSWKCYSSRISKNKFNFDIGANNGSSINFE